MRYVLDERAIRWRAKWSAALGSASTLAPALLVVVLVTKLGYAPERYAWGVSAVLLALAILRGFASHAQIARGLRAFAVTLEDDAIAIRTARRAVRVVRANLERIREVGGPLGGLRVEARGTPSRVDIPRGGERFGELRAALERWMPVVRPTRRSRGVRVALGALVVVSIFFVPFVLDDLVARSRVVAMGVVAAVWLAMFALRRA